MTTPYYTAVGTVGPADPKAGLRAKLYAVLSALLGLLGVAQTFGVLDSIQSASIGQIIAAVIALLGGGGLALATVKTTTQVKDGTFQEPVPLTPLPVVQAVDGLAAVATGFNDLITSVTTGLQQVQDTASNLSAVIPGLAGVASSLNPGSLAYQVAQAAGDRALASQALNAPSQAPGVPPTA